MSSSSEQIVLKCEGCEETTVLLAPKRTGALGAPSSGANAGRSSPSTAVRAKKSSPPPNQMPQIGAPRLTKDVSRLLLARRP